ncbi:hypothetical protein [Cloacibacillus evryensis]|uniref:hypothetical protein n=1 Tax=Cloacibacillus evryensis TaxID=508460 RepID=UPI00241C9396|nr:hypothetical protein [Cloacibacillus evryensis]
MRVIYEPKRQVVVVGKDRIKVITCAVQGPGAIPPDTYQAHVDARDNPHEVGLFQLLVPTGVAGQWVRFSDDGTRLIAVDPPLTEMPVLPQPIDEKVKADPADAVPGFLNAKVAGVLYVDESAHVVRLRGVMAGSYPPNYYYGTNDAGQLGFWPLPASLIQECGIGVEDEDEWLNTGAVSFYGWP